MTIPSENIKTITLPIYADPVGSGHAFYMMKAPRDLTILSAYMVSKVTQGAGTAVKIQLENWGTAGTAAIGTVTAIGGTAVASQLTANTPGAGSINADYDYFEQGEWLVAQYIEEGAGWVANDRFAVTVNYVIGLGA